MAAAKFIIIIIIFFLSGSCSIKQVSQGPAQKSSEETLEINQDSII